MRECPADGSDFLGQSFFFFFLALSQPIYEHRGPLPSRESSAGSHLHLGDVSDLCGLSSRERLNTRSNCDGHTLCASQVFPNGASAHLTSLVSIFHKDVGCDLMRCLSAFTLCPM